MSGVDSWKDGICVRNFFAIDMAVSTWFELVDPAVWKAFTSDVHLGCRQKGRTIAVSQVTRGLKPRHWEVSRSVLCRVSHNPPQSKEAWPWLWRVIIIPGSSGRWPGRWTFQWNTGTFLSKNGNWINFEELKAIKWVISIKIVTVFNQTIAINGISFNLTLF